MLFLLRDEQGRALMITMAGSQAEARAFGHNHLPEFCGDPVAIDAARSTADETTTTVWTRGLDLPEEVAGDGMLTPEDHRELTLDHIARTCEVVIHFQIRKWA